MNCDLYRDRLHEYLRSRLSEAEGGDVERHEAECADCRGYRESCEELTCREFVDFLHAYLDQDLPEERVTVFDRHLSVCSDCTNYLDSYRKTMGLSVTALSELATREIPEALVQAILAARKKN